MTQRSDQADQTAGAGVGPSGDGASGSGYGSGQGGARMMLGAILAACVVGLVAVFWPDDPGRSISVADRADEMDEDDQVVLSDDAVVNRDRETPPATGDQVRPARPDAAAGGPEASGEGLADTPPDMSPADPERDPEAEIDPAETVEAAEDPA